MQDGIRGYNTDAARGADTFHPFKFVHYVGNVSGYMTEQTFNIAALYPQYSKLTVNNFLIYFPGTYINKGITDGSYAATGCQLPKASYDATKGILTANSGGLWYDSSNNNVDYRIGFGIGIIMYA